MFTFKLVYSTVFSVITSSSFTGGGHFLITLAAGFSSMGLSILTTSVLFTWIFKSFISGMSPESSLLGAQSFFGLSRAIFWIGSLQTIIGFLPDFSFYKSRRSFSDLSGLLFIMLTGSWKLTGEIGLFSTVYFFWRRVRMSKFSSSKNMAFFLRLSLTIFSYFLIGLLLRSILRSTACMRFAWHFVSNFILAMALLLRRSPYPSDGGLSPWTILSVFWFLRFYRCLWTYFG